MKPIRTLAAAIAAASISSAYAGEAVFYVTEDGQAASNLAVTIDGKKKLVGKSGFVSFDLGAGKHSVELSEFGEWAGEFEFTAAKNQNAEIQIEMIGGEAVEEVTVYTPGQEESIALGKISGYLESEETGGGVAGARISIEGKESSTTTDSEGFYELELPRGEYTLNISDPNYGKREVKNLRVMSNVATSVNLTMSMSGDGVIEEVVAVGSYIPSTATAQERDSSAVLDAIGSEQFSRFGDSNAASALKRVAGVSISDGKYVVVRGLNERHSAIMLNGASLPSPDPSRRVVPLDIFPSSVLDGIEVQKTFTPNVYADSTGGAVRLSTKKFPQEFEGKLSVSLGYVDGLTGKKRNVQQSEGMDYLGFGADGDRTMPSGVESGNASFSQLRDIAASLPDNLKTEQQTIDYDKSVEVAFGDTFIDNDLMAVGYNWSFKYSNEWAKEDSLRTSLEVDGDQLKVDERFEYKRTSNDINLGTGLTVGAAFGNHELSSNTLLLRQTHAETTGIEGVTGDQAREVLRTNMLWLEREFFMQQFMGDHIFPELLETEVQWQISNSEATLDSPDERSYSFERDDADDQYELYWSSMNRVYNTLSDTNTDMSIDLSTLGYSDDSQELKVKYGFSMFARERDAENTVISYDGPGQTAGDYSGVTDVEEVVQGSIASGDLTITTDQSLPSNDYSATWDMTSYYLMTEYSLFDQFNLLVGARAENSELVVNTYTTGSTQASPKPENAIVEDNDMFPVASGTYFVTEDVQVRGAYYETKNRPDFRELANAQFTDPEEGDALRGNPSLVSAEVKNYDVRAEWYFSDNESISLAYFTKYFTNPIEKTLLPGGDVFSWKNGSEGSLSGFELDFRKEYEIGNLSAFVGGNYAVIDSEVDIVVEGVEKKQDMQGQPKDLANLQIGLDDLNNGSEYTILVSYQGETMHSVASGVLPNVIREPRTEIGFNFSQEVGESMKLKAKLKNINDDKVLLTQGGETFREYEKGMEISLGLNIAF